MQAIPLYHVEDQVKVRARLPELLGILNAETSYQWTSGFEGKEDIAWRDASELVNAIEDDRGIILLDINLKDANWVKTLTHLKREFIRRNIDISRHLTNDFVREILQKPTHHVGGYLLAAALTKGRRVIVTSSVGVNKDMAELLRVPRVTFPDGPGKIRKVAWRNMVDVILSTISKYAKAQPAWTGWITDAQSIFKYPGFHEERAWRDPKNASRLPPICPGTPTKDCVVDKAKRILMDCGCGEVEIDFVTAIQTLKGLAKEQFVPLSLVELFLRKLPGELQLQYDVKKFARLKSKNAGRVVVALSEFCSSQLEPEKGRVVRKNLTATGLGTCLISCTSKFRREADAKQAEIDLSPKSLEEESGFRFDDRQMTQACYWLRRDGKFSRKRDGRSLTLKFEFECNPRRG